MRLQSACARGVRVNIRRKHIFLRKWDWISHPKPCIFLEEYSHFERGAPKPSPHPLKQSTCGGMAQGRNSSHAKSAYSSKNIHFSANLGVPRFAVLGVLSYSSRKTPIWPLVPDWGPAHPCARRFHIDMARQPVESLALHSKDPGSNPGGGLFRNECRCTKMRNTPFW